MKPSKHVLIGLGLKSLTGSRKIIEILNRFGHCLSYHTIESIETDLAMTVSDRNISTPDGLVCEPGLSTAVAWDNYDENSETLSGSGTLHDTVGICYQNISTDRTESNRPIVGDIARAEEEPRRRHRKRTFTAEEHELTPYRKKPKVAVFNYEIKMKPPPDHLQQMRRRDQAWIMARSMYNTIPMWCGWNSQLTPDPLPQQRIGYMDNLKLPPTRHDVVAETMRISQRVATECKEQFAIVHYDLAVAKPAKQIQIQESPMYDNVFVCFGQFHILLAYFGSLGNIIEESGGPHILTDTNVLAAGSLNGFIQGRHYNRCKRLHPMLSAAFRVLHFERFMAETGQVMPTQLIDRFEKLKNDPSPESIQSLERMDAFNTLVDKYEEFTDRTRSGEHGKTALFWMRYIDLVELYLLFSRACHTNDLELFIYSLGKCVLYSLQQILHTMQGGW